MIRVAIQSVVLVICGGLLGGLTQGLLAEQKEKPLTAENVVVLLQGGIDEKSLIQEHLNVRGMAAARLDAESIQRLRDAGATDLLIANVAFQVGEAFLGGAGDFEESLFHFELSAKFFPNSVLPLLGIIRVHSLQSEFQKALEVCDRAVQMAPKDPDPLVARCRVLIDLAAYAKALDDAIAATKVAPSFFEGHRLVALLLAAAPVDELRDGDTALSAAANAIKLAEGNQFANHSLLRMTLAAAYAEKGDFENAARVQAEAVQLASESFKPIAATWLQNFQQKIKFRLGATERPKEAAAGNSDSPGREADRSNGFIQYLQKTMAEIPRGSFQMGSTKFAEADDERPVQQVDVEAFYLSKVEVTNRVYMFVMTGEADVPNGDHPVESVSWNECQAFLKRLNAMCGAEVFRLPTEAEWEYAARAGTRTEYYFGDDPAAISEHGWCKPHAGTGSHPVAQLKPNGWGLHDIHGNVGEWCDGRYAVYGTKPESSNGSPLRVFRGGSWANTEMYCRSAARSVGQSDGRLKGVGFRLAMDAAAARHLSSSKDGAQEQPKDLTIDQAIEQAERALAGAPGDSGMVMKLSSLLKQRAFLRYGEQKYASALADAEKALDLLKSHRPGDGVAVDCYALLAWIRATAPDDSVRDAEKAIQAGKIVCGLTNWEQWVPLSCLAAAYGEAGQFDRAIKRQLDAISKAPLESRGELEKRLEVYRAGKPLRIKGGF